MANTFPGYSRQALGWLRGLAEHNERDWFRAHRALYDTEVAAPTLALASALNERLARFAPQLVTEPRAAIHRIHRDLRFGSDKSPYKTHVAATFRRSGRAREESGALRFRISAVGVEVLGGAFAPSGAALRLLRGRFATDHVAFAALCRRRALRSAMGDPRGDTLLRVPRDWPPDHPAAAWLRHRQVYFLATLPVRIATTPDLLREIARRFRLLAPIVDFIDDAMAPRPR